VLGSDGSGKSTAIDDLEAWLSPVLEVDRVHLGKPPWSWTTRAVRAATKLGRMLTGRRFVSTAKALHAEGAGTPGLDVLLRELCTGRDRRLHHARARRRARRGALVLCDRHPLPEIRLMDGPVIGLLRPEGERGPLVRLLMALEERPYRRIGAPDLAIVLRVDPEEAVRRKPEDDPDYVRARATEIWTAQWDRPDVHVLDAGRPKDEVLAEVRRLVWANL
jgi:thymidylate kinase